ncbi:MAG: hypothetical protein V1860_03775 [bacterium]
MNIKNLKAKTGKFLLLNKNNLKTLEPRKNVLDGNIKYWLKNKELIALKKGFYVIREKYEKEPDKGLYLEYAANRIVWPSYISLEYVLAKYQLLSEPAQAITSITIKTTREVSNELNIFRYYTITEKLFTGYKIKYFQGAAVMEAGKPKALFDFLYLRFLRNEAINTDTIANLRINWENLNRKEFREVYSYLKFSNSRRLKKYWI